MIKFDAPVTLIQLAATNTAATILSKIYTTVHVRLCPLCEFRTLLVYIITRIIPDRYEGQHIMLSQWLASHVRGRTACLRSYGFYVDKRHLSSPPVFNKVLHNPPCMAFLLTQILPARNPSHDLAFILALHFIHTQMGANPAERLTPRLCI